MIGHFRRWMAAVRLLPRLAETHRQRAGYAVEVGRVRMKVGAERVTDPTYRRAFGVWLSRVDRLLGGEQRVDVEWSLVRITHRRGEHTELHWDGASGAALFDLVAAALGASPARIAAARGRPDERARSIRLVLDPTASTL